MDIDNRGITAVPITVQGSNAWQVARKGITPIELATVRQSACHVVDCGSVCQTIVFCLY